MPSSPIDRIVSNALSGGNTYRKTHRVTGVNVRGEAFSLDRPKFDAEDFAAEIIEKGGSATVTRIT